MVEYAPMLERSDLILPDSPRRRSPPRWPVVLLAVGAGLTSCVLACVLLLTLTLLRPLTVLPVTVMLDGVSYPVETSAATVRDLLTEVGVSLNSGDSLSPELDAAITANLVVQIVRARIVTLVVDGVEQSFQTRFDNPLDILKSANITLGDADHVLVDGTRVNRMDLLVWPVPVTRIEVDHALTVALEDSGASSVLLTTAPTVGEALYEAGVILFLADTVDPGLDTVISDGLVIRIQRSQPISIVADGVTLETRAQGATVADALASAGVALMGLDYSIPDENSPLQPGMSVRVIRVSEQVEQEQTVIPFETVYQADASMDLDTKRVTQEGQNGIMQINIRVRRENGSEISRTQESSGVAREPINRVLNYGTNIVIRTIDTPEGTKEYWRVLRMYTTSYHPAALGGDNITATGRVLTKGIVGIDPKIIPYGSQVYVPGYGVGLAADTGGPRKFKLWIDLGYDDENWVSWSKYTDVYLLTPIPASFPYMLPE